MSNDNLEDLFFQKARQGNVPLGEGGYKPESFEETRRRRRMEEASKAKSKAQIGHRGVAAPSITKMLEQQGGGGGGQGPAVTLLNGLVSFWECEEPSGNLIDSHGSNDAILSGEIGSAAGKIGNARLFSFTSANAPDAASLRIRDTDYTAAMWLKYTSLPTPGGSMGLFYKMTTGFGWGVRLTNNFGANYRLIFIRAGVDNYEATLTPDPVVDTWYHFLFTHRVSDHSIDLYWNGVLQTDTVGTKVIDFNPDDGLDFGIGTGSIDHNGAIDEVGVWNRILNTAEIAELAAGVTPYANFLG